MIMAYLTVTLTANEIRAMIESLADHGGVRLLVRARLKLVDALRSHAPRRKKPRVKQKTAKTKPTPGPDRLAPIKAHEHAVAQRKARGECPLHGLKLQRMSICGPQETLRCQDTFCSYELESVR